METLTVSRAHVTLDLLLYRRFGIEGQALVEEVLDGNPGLAGLGAVLPVGTTVRIPAQLPARLTAPRRAVVDLFGG